MENYIINPVTNRPILYNGAIHRRLLKTKQIQIVQKQANPIETEPIKPNPIKKKQINVNLKEKEQSDSDNDSDSDTNNSLQELFNKLNNTN